MRSIPDISADSALRTEPFPTQWTLKPIQTLSHRPATEFHPDNSMVKMYISGIAYASEYLPGVTSQPFAQGVVWIDQVAHAYELSQPAQVYNIRSDAFDTMYGQYPEQRDWYSLNLVAGPASGSPYVFPTGVGVFTADPEGENIVFVGFIDLEDM